MSILAAKPEETLVFGDSYSGITAAKKAKIKYIIAVNEDIENFKYKNDVYDVIKDFTNAKKYLNL